MSVLGKRDTPETESTVTIVTKIPSIIEDETIAKKYQLYTKIFTNDNHVLFTSWFFLQGFTYFEKLVDSGMKESESREIKINLDVATTKIYFNIITSDIQIAEGLLSSLCNEILLIYDQLDYHSILPILDICKSKILELPFSVELYEWNKIHNIIPIKDMFIKMSIYIQNIISSKETHQLPNESEEEYYSEYIKFINEYPISNDWKHITVYITICNMQYINAAKYVKLFKSHDPTIFILKKILTYTKHNSENQMKYIKYLITKSKQTEV